MGEPKSKSRGAEDAVVIQYTREQRLRRAWGWWALGFALISIVWTWALRAGAFPEMWWTVLPAAIPIFIGYFKYSVRGYTRPVHEAKKDNPIELKSYDAPLAEVDASPSQRKSAQVEQMPWYVRYFLVVPAFLYGAYYFSNEQPPRHAGWLPTALVIFAALAAVELSCGLVVALLVGTFLYALFGAIAALPTSVAIIIAAYIIAGRKKD